MKQKNQIHVAYIITKLELGGAQKVCLQLFNRLQNADISSHLISGAQGTLIDAVKHHDNLILVDHFKRECSFIAIFNEIRCMWHLIKELKKLKKIYPTLLVHTHSTKAGIIGRWAAWCAGITTRIHTIHGYGFHDHQSWLSWMVIYILELITSSITTHYICVSSLDMQIGEKLFPFFSRKCSLIRAAVNSEQFHPAYVDRPFDSLQNAPFIFGTVSCFKPQKNLLDLLKAFALLHADHPHARLEIVGDGIQRTMIEQWIKEHNLSDAVLLHGWQHDVASIMNRWHTFVLSSLWEGLPCAVIEARLLKLPVLCYDTGGIKDVIFHEKNGMIYKQKDWKSLSHGMMQVCTDMYIYAQLRTYPDNLDAFHTHNMIDKHATLYKKLCLQKNG
jgi:glycosyltransferase involved in cell wall biosynthesis